LNDIRSDNTLSGILKSYKIFNFIWFSLGSIAGLGLITLMIWEFKFSSQNTIDNAALILELLPTTIFSFIIWRMVSVKKSTTPSRIKSVMRIDLLFSLIIGVILYLAFKKGFITDKPVPFLGSVIYYFIWSSYFNSSKKVLSYYGFNS
jgi:hypothetical protein